MQHIESLRRADEGFRAQTHYRVIVAELDAQAGQYALRALVDVLPPNDLGLCIGEVGHNLRSALDGLIYQLGKANRAKEKTLAWTQFPIYLNADPPGCVGKCPKGVPAHFGCRGLRLIKPLKDAHKTVIERLQPYQAGNGGKDSPLYLLNELNNADKHRLLQVIGGKAMGYSGGGAWGNNPMPDYFINTSAVLEDGAKVGYVAATDVAARNVRMSQNILPYIGFWEGCEAVTGRGVTFTLSPMADEVSKVIEGFGPEFG